MFSYKFFRIATLAVLMTVVAMLNTASTQQDAPDCGQTIVDEAGVFGNRFLDVEQAAVKLNNIGADVRVRTAKTIGIHASLSHLMLVVEQRCKSWQGASGKRKNNLVVLAAAMREEKTMLVYGSQWGKPLGQQWPRIQADLINPRFKDKDFIGGFVVGINEITGLIDLHLHPAVAGGTSVVVVERQQSAPMDYSGLWIALKYLLIIIMLALIGYGLLLRRQQQERRRAAQQQARLAKQAAAALVNRFSEQFIALELGVQTRLQEIAPDDAASMVDALASAKSTGEAGVTHYTSIAMSNAADPDADGLSVLEYAETARAYNAVAADFHQADEYVGACRAKLVLNEPKAARQRVVTSLKAAEQQAADALEIVAGQDTGDAETRQFRTIIKQVNDVLSAVRAGLERDKPSYTRAGVAIQQAMDNITGAARRYRGSRHQRQLTSEPHGHGDFQVRDRRSSVFQGSPSAHPTTHTHESPAVIHETTILPLIVHEHDSHRSSLPRYEDREVSHRGQRDILETPQVVGDGGGETNWTAEANESAVSDNERWGNKLG